MPTVTYLTADRTFRNNAERQGVQSLVQELETIRDPVAEPEQNVMRRRLFIYYLTQKSLHDSMIYQTIQKKWII